MNMTHRDRVVAVLKHRPPGIVPYYEVYMDSNAEKKFLGPLSALPGTEYKLRYA